jgi:outer membrane lipoprotein LolB
LYLYRLAPWVLLAALLAGCTSVPRLPEAPERFALKGKLAVREAGQNYTANVLWHQTEEGFQIDLWGPLGQGRMQLVKQGAEILLKDGQGAVLTSGDAETVMRRELGWTLPVDVLPAWVQGQPLETIVAHDLTQDDSGRISAFRQLDWRVELDRYETLVDGAASHDLPTRVTAENERTRLRLVISEWQI